MKNNTRNTCMVANLSKTILIISFFLISLQICGQEPIMKEDNPRFTFEFTETPIKNVFDHIQKHSNYIFLYYGGVVNANHKVSIKISNSTIDEVLRQLFKDTSITYTFKDRQIILKKKEQEVFSGQKKP